MSQIATAKQQSATQVYVYDDNGNYKFCVSGELMGFTSTTVTVKPNPSSDQVYVYDDNGNYKFCR